MLRKHKGIPTEEFLGGLLSLPDPEEKAGTWCEESPSSFQNPGMLDQKLQVRKGRFNHEVFTWIVFLDVALSEIRTRHPGASSWSPAVLPTPATEAKAATSRKTFHMQLPESGDVSETLELARWLLANFLLFSVVSFLLLLLLLLLLSSLLLSCAPHPIPRLLSSNSPVSKTLSPGGPHQSKGQSRA